jgi:signal transduction histidine kinase
MQEALNNVARHSEAKQAWVRLRSQGDMIELDVEDHGRGTDPGATGLGLGIVAMRERAEMLGGSIEFLQPADGGTLVRLRVPVEGKDAYGE